MFNHCLLLSDPPLLSPLGSWGWHFILDGHLLQSQHKYKILDQSAQCRHGRGFIARRAARVASALMPALASALSWYLCWHKQNFRRSLQPEHEHSLSNSKPYKPSNIHNKYTITLHIYIRHFYPWVVLKLQTQKYFSWTFYGTFNQNRTLPV